MSRCPGGACLWGWESFVAKTTTFIHNKAVLYDRTACENLHRKTKYSTNHLSVYVHSLCLTHITCNSIIQMFVGDVSDTTEWLEVLQTGDTRLFKVVKKQNIHLRMNLSLSADGKMRPVSLDNNLLVLVCCFHSAWWLNRGQDQLHCFCRPKTCFLAARTTRLEQCEQLSEQLSWESVFSRYCSIAK